MDATTAATAADTIPAEAHIAGLRTRLISKLTGLKTAQLRYWHDSGLLEASTRPGSRGIPRLYSWVDYLRLQVARELGQSVRTGRVRDAVEFLDEHFTAWYLLPVYARNGHVAAEVVAGASPLLADAAGQHTLPWPDDLVDIGESVGHALAAIRRRGPLCLLSAYDDAVTMHPAMNLAQPTLAGSALETHFVTGMTADIGLDAFVRLYSLDARRVKRAIEFERAVA